jgi:SAM-dependent methyltransferase
MDPRPSTVEQPHWDRFRDTAIGRYLLEHEAGFLRRSLGRFHEPPRVLELCACGGRLTLPLRDAMSGLVALDIDRDALRYFHRSSGLPAVTGDAQALPFAPASFDCVVAVQCLRYFDRQVFLRECWDVLRPDGALVVQAINRRGYKRRLKELVRPRRRHWSTTTSGDEVVASIAAAGFEVTTVEGYNWLPFRSDMSRLSDTVIVDGAAWLERRLGARRHLGLSPWILVEARKRLARPEAPIATATVA